MNDRLAVSVVEAAKMLGVSRPTMYQLIRREDFPAARIGGRVLIPVKQLEEWLEKQSEKGEIKHE